MTSSGIFHARVEDHQRPRHRVLVWSHLYVNVDQLILGNSHVVSCEDSIKPKKASSISLRTIIIADITVVKVLRERTLGLG